MYKTDIYKLYMAIASRNTKTTKFRKLDCNTMQTTSIESKTQAGENGEIIIFNK